MTKPRLHALLLVATFVGHVPALAVSKLVDELDEFTDERQLYFVLQLDNPEDFADRNRGLSFLCGLTGVVPLADNNMDEGAVQMLLMGDSSYRTAGAKAEVQLRFDTNPAESRDAFVVDQAAVILNADDLLDHTLNSSKFIIRVDNGTTMRFKLQRRDRSNLNDFVSRCDTKNASKVRPVEESEGDPAPPERPNAIH